MNEELKTKTDDFRKRAPIPKLFIFHYSLFTLHSSLFIYKGKVTSPVPGHVDI